MVVKSLTLFLLLCLSISLGMAGALQRMVTAVRTVTPPVIDGWVNDVQWQTVPAVLDFTQFDPDEGKTPTEKTSVRLLYDNRALYVGVVCYDSHPERIVRQLTRRDRSSEADRFSVMIDSFFDRQTGFVFVTNVSGVQSDGVLSRDGAIYDITWDAVWTVRTRTSKDGWSAEFEIPYNALRFAEQANGAYKWGINFRRYISRKKETDEWIMVPRSDPLQISKWGIVDGISNITPPLHLELLPYVSGTATYATAEPGRSGKGVYEAQAGLDLKYGVTRNFTLDATFNPDFGQVEVDQSVLNLTVFETRYPEKRPFFVEGAQLFTFGSSADNTPLALFFSRRIGKRPSGGAFVIAPPGGSIQDNPLVTTILGAAKVSGRTNSGLSIGALTAVTDEEHALIVTAAGSRSTVRTEPLGSYNVVRMKQDFEGGSWVGGIGTLASRRNTSPAFAGGLDWNVRLDDGASTLDGYAAGARSSTNRTELDGSSGNEGAAGRLLFSRLAAEHWLYAGSFDFYTRYFSSNDLGFFAQPHDYGGYVQLIYRENFATGIFRRYAMSVVPEFRQNWDRVLTRSMVEFTMSADLTNFWRPVVVYDLFLPAYDDEERGITGTYKRPLAHSILAQITSDERMNVSATATGIYAFDEKRKRSWTASLALTVRPVSSVEISPTLYWMHTKNEETWVFPNGGSVSDAAVSATKFSVFGDRNVHEIDFALRGIITFTRNLSLQFYSQVLLARGTYANYRRFVGNTALAYNYPSNPNYDPDFDSGDFNKAAVNANVLVRWEYLPGSTLYFVWTQERFGDSGAYRTDFGTRLGEAFALPREDVLLVKLSYWLPL